MTASSYIPGKMLGLSAMGANGLGIGTRADRLWGAPPELTEQAPVRIGQGVEGNGNSLIHAEMGDALGAVQGTSGSDSSFQYKMMGRGFGGASPSKGSDLFGQVHGCLRNNGISPLLSDMALERACDRSKVSPQEVTSNNLPQLIPSLEVALKVFVEGSKLVGILEEIRALDGGTTMRASPFANLQREEAREDADVIAIDNEDAIVKASQAAMKYAEKVGLRTADTCNVATVVSELARNIVHYADSGTVEFRSLPNGMEIVARDIGPGIPHIDDVLSGKWRSGRKIVYGLRSSKKVMTTFDVQTVVGKGTTITATKLKNR